MLWIRMFAKPIVGMILAGFVLGMGSVVLGYVSPQAVCIHYESGYQIDDRARIMDLRYGLDARDPYAASEQRWTWMTDDYELITRNRPEGSTDIILRRLDNPTDPGQMVQGGVDSTWALQARWSPDEQQVAFIWRDSDSISWLNRARPGEAPHPPAPLTQARADQSQNLFGGWYVHGWSGDQQWVSLAQQTSTSFHYTLWSTENLTESQLELPTALYDAEWSPSGATLAAIGAGDQGYRLWLIRPDSQPKVVQSAEGALFNGSHRLAWSPDGQAVAVSTSVVEILNGQRTVRWRHDLYRANGTPLQVDIPGYAVRVPVELDAYSQTVSTQDVVPALWSGDRRWVSLQNATAGLGGLNLELVAVDALTGQREVVSRGLLPEYAGAMFAIRLNPPSLVRSDPFRGPFEPQGHYLVMPMRTADGASVALLDLRDLTSETLVADADEIVNQVLHFGVEQPFWSWGGERVAVVWMKDDAAHLSIAQIDTGERLQIDTGAMGITYHDWPRPDWLTYVTHHEDGQRLHLLNSRTGKDWMLVESNLPIDNWGVSIAQSGTAAAAMISPLTPGYGAGDLYVASAPGEPARPVERGLTSWLSFSDDGDRMAFFETGTWPFRRTVLHVMNPDGSGEQRFLMNQNISGRGGIDGWSNCTPTLSS
jgi:Tol biopolymer transport system component